MSNWSITNYRTVRYIIHKHDIISIFIPKDTCPLCKEKIPNFILFQTDLLDSITQFYCYTILFLYKSKGYDLQDLSFLEEKDQIREIFQNYGKTL